MDKENIRLLIKELEKQRAKLEPEWRSICNQIRKYEDMLDTDVEAVLENLGFEPTTGDPYSYSKDIWGNFYWRIMELGNGYCLDVVYYFGFNSRVVYSYGDAMGFEECIQLYHSVKDEWQGGKFKIEGEVEGIVRGANSDNYGNIIPDASTLVITRVIGD